MTVNLHVRNVDDDIARALKLRAAQNGMSAEAQHREILKQALIPGHYFDWEARAAALRHKLAGKITLRSEDIIREERDAR